MPIITPQDLISYSTFKKVHDRPAKQLEMDILEAQTFVNQEIEKPLKEYQPLPEELKLAVLKVAQFYALINSDESLTKGYKSERFENYSYTLADGETIRKPDVSDLLANFKKKGEQEPGSVRLRMRSL